MGHVGSQNICGNCGTVNAASEQFCGNCGYSLAGGPTSASPNTVTVLSSSSAGGRRITGALVVGNLVGGRYRIIKLVGKGGFGAVYQAGDERFQAKRMVAIKEMSDGHLSPGERLRAIRDFRQEADLLVQLKHPNLPDVSDFFEESGKAYLVMEFIEGKTLENELDDAGGPLDEKLVMGWALQLCDVLNYLHIQPQPIIFRDMKPSNVMLNKDGKIKLIDFGIARIFKSAAAKDTTSLGSRGFAPLEQHGRGQTDARSDIYALGATLYNLLTHEVPVDAPARVISPQLFEPPRQLNPSLSPATESIVLKAMEQDPKNRFQSADEMARAIIASGAVASLNMTTLGTYGATTLQNNPQAASAAIIASPTIGGPTIPALPAVAAPVGIGAPPFTPQQQQQQFIPPPQQRRGISRRALLGLGATGAIAVGAGFYFFSRNGGQSVTPGPANTITVNFTYSTEKHDWMQAATDAFHKQGPAYNNKAIQIVLDERGSVDGKARILSGEIQPMAWSPASFLELNQLSVEWQEQHGGSDIIINTGDLLPKSLVFSPLVFAVWKERAEVLLKHYGTIDWSQIHDALTKNNWSDIGGQAAWGPVKFGQTRPDESNSGLLTITLMAYAYYNEERGLTAGQVTAPGFMKYFQDIEGAVNAFGRSSGTWLANVVLQDGPAQYDILTTYENLVLTLQTQAIQRQHQALLMFYPSVNIESDHPFAILQTKGVTDEQRMAARVFRDFLLDAPQQRLALASGFRPTNPGVQITDAVPGNAFRGQSPDITINPQIQSLAQAPNGTVVDKLIQQWSNLYGTAATTPGG